MTPDMIVKAKTAEDMLEFLSNLERAMGRTGWIRDRQEERSPHVVMPEGCIVLCCTDAVGRPNLKVTLAPDAQKRSYRTHFYGPYKANWILQSWGFSFQVKRETAQALLSTASLIDLLGHVLKTANEMGGIEVSLEPAP